MIRPTHTPPLVADVVAVLQQLYPEGSAESWDAVGLVCGDPAAPVRRIHYAVDPTAEVIDEAIEAGADMLICHHPLLLKGVHGVPANTFKGAAVHSMIRAGVALYVAHTNADRARPGVNDALARRLGLDHLKPLVADETREVHKLTVFVPTDATERVIDVLAAAGAGELGEYSRCAYMVDGQGTFTPGHKAKPAVGQAGVREVVPERRIEMLVPAARVGDVLAVLRTAHPYEEPAFDVIPVGLGPAGTGIGRLGELPEPMTLEAFARHVALVLPYTVTGVRVAGPADAPVQRVAVCGGSGDSFFSAVRASGADVYLTSDLRHHPASEAREQASGSTPYLVDVAHFASEWPWLSLVADRVAAAIDPAGDHVDYEVSRVTTDPWTFRIPSQGGLVR